MQTALNFFFVLVGVQLLQHDVSPNDQTFILLFTIGGMLAINWLGSIWLKTNAYRWLLPLVSLILLGWFGKNELHYSDYSIDFSDIRVLSILFIGIVTTFCARIIQHLLFPFFNPKDEYAIQQTAMIILLGFSVLIATFFVSWYGILLLAIGHFLYNCFSRSKNDHIILSLLLLSSVGAIVSRQSIESIDLTVGKMLFGLLTGAGVYLLSTLAFKSIHDVVRIVFLVLSVILLSLVAFFDNIHPAYGGVDAFLAAWITIALIHLFIRNNNVGIFLFPILLIIGLIIPTPQQEEITTPSKTTQQQTPKIDPLNIPGKNADIITGVYKIDEQTSTLSFQLGPKGGIVKGAINNFNGTIDFGTNIETAKFNVKLLTDKLTTYNALRDKNVLGDKYLKVNQFPEMKFTANKMQKQNDGYRLYGKFTMLGITQPQEVFIKYIGEEYGRKKFVGQGVVDHAKFGVPASPQESKGVEFTFEIELASQK